MNVTPKRSCALRQCVARHLSFCSRKKKKISGASEGHNLNRTGSSSVVGLTSQLSTWLRFSPTKNDVFPFATIFKPITRDAQIYTCERIFHRMVYVKYVASIPSRLCSHTQYSFYESVFFPVAELIFYPFHLKKNHALFRFHFQSNIRHSIIGARHQWKRTQHIIKWPTCGRQQSWHEEMLLWC